MAMSNAERQAAWRARRKAGAPPRAIAACGTRSGYKRHLRLGQPPCGPCSEANAEYHRDYYNRSR